MTLVEFYESREDWEYITLIGCWIARRGANGGVPDYNTGWCGADREAREDPPQQETMYKGSSNEHAPAL